MEAKASERTFPRFPNLPLEIRLQIWRDALPGPRLVEIHQKPLKTTVSEWLKKGGSLSKIKEYLLKGPADPMLGLASDCHPPAMLLSSKESYRVASKVYIKAFAMAGSNPDTYFDFKRDTLYFRYDLFRYGTGEWPTTREALRFLDGIKKYSGLHKVENLALLIDRRAMNKGAEELTLNLVKLVVPALRTCANIKNLTLVVEHYAPENKVESPCCFLDPMDIENTLQEIYTYGWAYCTRSRTPSYASGVPYDEIPLAQILQAMSKKDAKLGRAWKVPNIEYKMVVPEATKDEYEIASQNCKKSLHEYLLQESENAELAAEEALEGMAYDYDLVEAAIEFDEEEYPPDHDY